MDNLVGSFKYHSFAVDFTCDEDAGVARVIYTQDGDLIDDTTHTFEKLQSNFIGSARSHFENCVQQAIGYTSRSMVEDYVQHG